MISSRHQIASTFVLPRPTSIRGGRLLRLSLSILCLLVFLAPAQAQTPPTATNIRINDSTGIITWSNVGTVTAIQAFAFEIERLADGSISQPFGASDITSFNLHIGNNCCTIGETYEIRIIIQRSIGSSNWFSSVVTFTYCGTSCPPRGAKERERKPTPTPGPIPTQDHSQLPAGAELNSDSIWISMREVSGAAIGDPAVRAAAMSAIDIWAPLDIAAEVCFAEDGSLLLLDAAYSPRRHVWMDSYQRADGKTCARLDRNGTVVLMPAQPAAAATSAPQATATPNPYLIADNPDDAVPLEDCMVRANYVLNFRERPAGRFISLYLGNSEAIARTENWFQVEYLGETGWISAHFVTTEGDCE